MPVSNNAAIKLRVGVFGQCALAIRVDGVIRRVEPSIGSWNRFETYEFDKVYANGPRNAIYDATLHTTIINARADRTMLQVTQVGSIELLVYAVGKAAAVRAAPLPHFRDPNLRGKRVSAASNSDMHCHPTHAILPVLNEPMDESRIPERFENITVNGVPPLMKIVFYLRSQGTTSPLTFCHN